MKKKLSSDLTEMAAWTTSLATVLCAAWLAGAGAVWLNLPPGGSKCVSEEIQADNVVLGEYAVVQDPNLHATISVKVTSPYGNIAYIKENVTNGEFAFTTSESGNYQACISLDTAAGGYGGVSVSLDWKIGIAARDWQTVARKEKIEGVELELRKLELVTKEIHDKLLVLRDKESKMRDTSESTNSRVALFSIMSLGVCVVVASLQLWHLKTYFRKKKLI